eukprot:762529-Hanusia_phi.AAC.1
MIVKEGNLSTLPPAHNPDLIATPHTTSSHLLVEARRHSSTPSDEPSSPRPLPASLQRSRSL